MKFVTFGEIMARISPVDFKRIVQTNMFEITYGGGEANVAVSLVETPLPVIAFATVFFPLLTD